MTNGLNGGFWKALAVGSVSLVLLVQIWIDVDHMRVAQEQANRKSGVAKIDGLEQGMHELRNELMLMRQRMTEQDRRMTEMHKVLNDRLFAPSGVKRYPYHELE